MAEWDNNQNQEVESQEANESEDNVKPVKLSKGATAAILIAGIIIILIIGLTIRGCTLEKEVNSSENGEVSNPVSTISVENTQKPVETSAINVENSTVSQEVITAPAEISTTGNTDENYKNVNQLNEVPEPSLGEQLQTTGIVVSKHSYSYQGGYIYSITLSMLVGDTTKSAQYFCPKNTYDALNSADTINIIYQQDSAGAVSICSISN